MAHRTPDSRTVAKYPRVCSRSKCVMSRPRRRRSTARRARAGSKKTSGRRARRRRRNERRRGERRTEVEPPPTGRDEAVSESEGTSKARSRHWSGGRCQPLPAGVGRAFAAGRTSGAISIRGVLLSSGGLSLWSRGWCSFESHDGFAPRHPSRDWVPGATAQRPPPSAMAPPAPGSRRSPATGIWRESETPATAAPSTCWREPERPQRFIPPEQLTPPTRGR